MKNKIIIGNLFAVLLLVTLPAVSAVNDMYNADYIKSTDLENSQVSDEVNFLNDSIWELIDIYIEMMYHLRLTRVQMWYLIANIFGLTGTFSALIYFRAFLLETRAKVSRDVFGEVIDLLQIILP